MSEFLDFSPYLRTLLATGFVASLAALAIFLYKRHLQTANKGHETIEVVNRFRLDQKSSLIHVKVLGRDVLVGITNGGIALAQLTGEKLTAEFKRNLESEIEKSRDGNRL